MKNNTFTWLSSLYNHFKDKSLKCRKNKGRSFHGNRFTSFSTEQMEAPPTSSCSDKLENDKIGTSLSAKTLKLNLDSQSSENDNSVDGNVIDMNVDLEISEDDIDTDDHCHSSNFYEQRYVVLCPYRFEYFKGSN